MYRFFLLLCLSFFFSCTLMEELNEASVNSTQSITPTGFTRYYITDTYTMALPDNAYKTSEVEVGEERQVFLSKRIDDKILFFEKTGDEDDTIAFLPKPLPKKYNIFTIRRTFMNDARTLEGVLFYRVMPRQFRDGRGIVFVENKELGRYEEVLHVNFKTQLIEEAIDILKLIEKGMVLADTTGSSEN